MNENVSIQIKDVSRAFGKTQALDSVSFSFCLGGIHGIIGSSGAGKTTLLRIMLSLLCCDKGEISYYEKGKLTDFEKIKENIAYMPQKQSLYSDLSISEHLRFFASMYGISTEVFRSRSEKLLKITRLSKFIDRPAGKLSGGMYKKLGLMCALLRSPKVILLDEPTNGVDPISRREFWDILQEFASSGVLIILSTSYMDEAERCHCVHLLEHGRAVDEGKPPELLKKESVTNFDEFFIKRSQWKNL